MDEASGRPSLITGAAGFIGSRLALTLLAEGSEVRALVRPEHDTRELEAAGATILRGDASDRATVTAAAEGCGVVFHLAAARGPRKLGYRSYQVRNRKLSEAVGAAALAACARLVVTSTTSVTGYSGPDCQTEETTPKPNSAYRSSRLQDEQIFERLERETGLDVVIARVSQLVMGPGARDWARVVRAVRDGTVRFLPADGSVHSADVDDVIDGLRRCAVAPGIGGDRFLLGAAESMSTVCLLQTIADLLGVAFRPRIVPAAPARAYVAMGNLVYRCTRLSLPHHFTAEFYSARIVLDIGRARRELGYSPRFSMSEGIGRTVRWLQEHGLV